MTQKSFQFFMIFSICLLCKCLVAQVELIEDFSIQNVSDELDTPVGLVFDDDGKMYAWEKKGRVWIIDQSGNESRVLLDISDEVSNFGDLGFMSIALDPRFTENGYLYCYYAVDYHHLMHFETSEYDPEKDDPLKATIGRLTRYTVDFSGVDYEIEGSSRKILIGKTKDKGVPILHNSHIGGSIVFGDDGTLLLSIGDCSTWEGAYVGDGPPYYNAKINQALDDGILRPEEEVGAMRSQMINSYSGKIIRIDPQTGLGLTSNPFYTDNSPDSPRSKVWALGFRNPYRMTIRRGSGSNDPAVGLPGTLFVGEVGAGEWEELNIVTKKGENFGWPIFEGNNYGSMATLIQTNKEVLNDCNGDYVTFQDLIKQPSLNEVIFHNPCDSSQVLHDSVTFVHRRPDLALAHITAGLGVYSTSFDSIGDPEHIRIEDAKSGISSDVGNIRSNAVLAGSIYTGDQYPEEYKNDLFISDFNNGWVARVELDLNENVTGIYKFYKDTFKIAHLTQNPTDGCLYIAEYKRGIRKICYDVNATPIVHVDILPQYGASPLIVDFDASSSYDPEGGEIKFQWDFGDGSSGSSSKQQHTYESNSIETFEGKLVVSDPVGGQTTKKWQVSINNTPPSVEIKGIKPNYFYSVAGNNLLDLQADVYDQESPSSDLLTSWTLFLHHNTHFHEEIAMSGEEVSIIVPPVGCEDEIYYYRILLQSTDPFGLTGKDEVLIFPDCSDVFAQFESLQAKLKDSKIVLNWATTWEKGLSKFLIEKAKSNKVFNIMVEMEAQNSDMEAQYQFVDANPFVGPNYYRIKMLGNSGSEAYSDEANVFFNPNDGVYLFPNPISGVAKFHFNNLEGNAKFLLYDLSGRLLQREYILGNGESTKNIRLDDTFISGYYPYKIINGDSVYHGTLIVVK